MEASERKAKGINKKGEPRKNAERKYRGASRIVEFACGHVGHGKFCHRCEQLKRGELIEKGDKLVPNPKWVSEGRMADYIREQYPESRNMYKHEIIEFYLTKESLTMGELRKKLGVGG